jgi:hypothetical protein
MAGFDPRLSGLVLVDRVHGIDSTGFGTFGDGSGHERRAMPCGITIASFMLY